MSPERVTEDLCLSAQCDRKVAKWAVLPISSRVSLRYTYGAVSYTHLDVYKRQDTVVLHPPFRWQREYAVDFEDGVATREDHSGIRLAVENMFPWRARGREMQAYLPHWDPVPMAYDHVTLDLSHTATAGSDALAMVEALGPRPVSYTHLDVYKRQAAHPGPAQDARPAPRRSRRRGEYGAVAGRGPRPWRGRPTRPSRCVRGRE